MKWIINKLSNINLLHILPVVFIVSIMYPIIGTAIAGFSLGSLVGIAIIHYYKI